jgi:hypothetical protein
MSVKQAAAQSDLHSALVLSSALENPLHCFKRFYAYGMGIFILCGVLGIWRVVPKVPAKRGVNNVGASLCNASE